MAYQFKNRRGFYGANYCDCHYHDHDICDVGDVNEDREKKKFEAAGREVAAAVREAQNNALTGKQKDNNSLPVQ